MARSKKRSEYFYNSKVTNAKAIVKLLTDSPTLLWQKELAALKKGVQKYGLKAFVYLAIRAKLVAQDRGSTVKSICYYTANDFGAIEHVLATVGDLVYKESRVEVDVEPLLQARIVPSPIKKQVDVERIVFNAASPCEKIKRLRRIYD